eukprot:scaffold5.g617.t1
MPSGEALAAKVDPLRANLLPAADDGGSTGEQQPEALSDDVAWDADRREAAELAAAKREGRRALFGLFLYALSTIAGTGMSLFAKLAGERRAGGRWGAGGQPRCRHGRQGRSGIGVFEVVLFRSLALVAFTTPELLWARVNPFGDDRRWLYMLRGALGFCSTSSLYLAVTLLPMADAAVLAFLSPIFVALLSPLLLREHPSRAVFLAIPFCALGALFNAAARMSVRAIHSMGGEERMGSIIFSMGLVSGLLSSASMALPGHGFVWPTTTAAWGALAGNGVLGYANQVALTAALQRAKAAPAVAMGYLSVVWGLLADVIIFADYPTALSLVGTAIVCASSCFVALGEKRQREKERAAIRWRASQARLAAASAQDLEAAAATAESGGLREPLLPRGARPGSPAGDGDSERAAAWVAQHKPAMAVIAAGGGEDGELEGQQQEAAGGKAAGAEGGGAAEELEGSSPRAPPPPLPEQRDEGMHVSASAQQLAGASPPPTPRGPSPPEGPA